MGPCWHHQPSGRQIWAPPRPEKPAPPLAGRNGRNRPARASLLRPAARRGMGRHPFRPPLAPALDRAPAHARPRSHRRPPPPRWPRPRWGARRRPPTGPSPGGVGGRGRGRWGTARRPPRVCWRRRRSSRRRSRRLGAGGEGARWHRSPRSWRRGPPRSRRCRARRASGTTARRRRLPSTRSWPTPTTATALSGSKVLQLNSRAASSPPPSLSYRELH